MFDNAIINYEEAIRLHEKYFKARRNLILANFEKGNRSRSIQLAKELAQLDPNGENGNWAKRFLEGVQ